MPTGEVPRHPLAQEFLRAAGTPVVAPSANLSGRPSPTTWRAVFEDLNDRIDCILQGQATEIGLESTVVDCSGDRPAVLRLGSVNLEQILSITPDAVIAGPNDGDIAKSPGMMHKHYSPEAKVMIVDGPAEIVPDENIAYIGISKPAMALGRARVVGDLEEYAHELFEFFRECDRAGIRTVYCEAVAEDGIGAAVMDRIRRATQG